MVSLSRKHEVLGLIISAVVCYTVSFLGAIASINAKDFYGLLDQPSWSPPGWLFGPVWLALYTMMAVSAWLVWRIDGFRSQRSALILFIVHLIPNALWSWLFFHWQLGAASFINIIILWLLIVATMIVFFRISKTAGLLLLPYLCWVSFAAVLNYTLWQNNPSIL